MASKIEFKRDNDVTHYFVMDYARWSPGGTLYFTAKPAIDDDAANSAAIINAAFTDTNATNDGVFVTYTCTFGHALTAAIPSKGKKKADYLAAFKFIDAAGNRSDFPGDDTFLDAVLYFNVRNG